MYIAKHVIDHMTEDELKEVVKLFNYLDDKRCDANYARIRLISVLEEEIFVRNQIEKYDKELIGAVDAAEKTAHELYRKYEEFQPKNGCESWEPVRTPAPKFEM